MRIRSKTPLRKSIPRNSRISHRQLRLLSRIREAGTTNVQALCPKGPPALSIQSKHLTWTGFVSAFGVVAADAATKVASRCLGRKNPWSTCR